MHKLASSYPRLLCTASVVGLASILVSCSGTPFALRTMDELKASVVESAGRELRPLGEQRVEVTPTGRPETASFLEERLEELDSMGGPVSYLGADSVLSRDIREDLTDEELGRLRDAEEDLFRLGTDLLGAPTRTFDLSLQQAVASAVEHNLNVQIARLEPAISEAQVARAESVFDWVFFADYDFQKIDQVQQTPIVAGTPVGVGSSRSVTNAYETGIRKSLTTGGQITASQGQRNSNNLTTGFALFPDPSNSVFLDLGLTQPLLRGAGKEVGLAQVRLNQNLERSTIYSLKLALIQTVRDTEAAYWRLFQAQAELDIQRRSLLRGILTRDILEKRLNFDARPAEYSDAVATVERRRNALILAEQAVRDASDSLKVFINDPALSVTSEVLIRPVDRAITDPITFSLLDSVITALDERPEIGIAILNMDSASIQQAVAENNLLPTLDLSFRARFQGLDSDVEEAYEQIGNGRFVDYTLGVEFEQPIGNRPARSLFRQRELERLQAVVAYRQAVQGVARNLKVALRGVDTTFRLIQQSRISRLAATDNLRALRVLEQTIQQLDPNFLDLKFGRQDALAAAELEEVRAMVSYNIAITNYYAAEGTVLARNGIELLVPDADEIP